MRVVVIGAGLGGLAAAAHIRGNGHDVVVVERDALPGGRAGLVTGQGYRLDTGPTVLTMPDLVAATLAAVDAELDDFCPLKPVDPMYRAVYADGSELRVWHGREQMEAEIAAVCGGAEAAAFGRFTGWLAELYEIEMANFIATNYDSPLDLVRPIAPAIRLLRHGGFRKLARVVGSYFADDRLRRLFSFQSMYAGLAPYEALALYAVITYMDTMGGVFVPTGGMHALGTGLASALEKAGVEMRYHAPVARILRASGTSGAVIGVELEDGERLAADVVVCNPDLPVAYRTLLGETAPRAARRGRYSPSCFVWAAGVRGLPPDNAAHHNIHFGREWDEAFRAVMREGRRMPDPSLLVTLHSHGVAGLAPEGCSSLYVLEPVPNLDGHIDWTTERERITADLRTRVQSLGYPTEVEIETLIDPLDWERQGMERGTPFALAHTFAQTGPFRPGNVDRRIPGLVFVGSSTVPGVGVPMVLISGKLAAERVEEQHRARRTRP